MHYIFLTNAWFVYILLEEYIQTHCRNKCSTNLKRIKRLLTFNVATYQPIGLNLPVFTAYKLYKPPYLVPKVALLLLYQQ